MDNTLRERVSNALKRAKADYPPMRWATNIIGMNENTGMTHAQAGLDLGDEKFRATAYGRPDEAETRALAKCLQKAGYLAEEGGE